MSWCIGMPVVALGSSSDGDRIKGKVYTIVGLRQCVCKCGGVELDVNIRDYDDYDFLKCSICLHEEPYMSVVWQLERHFAPLDQDISELTEILTQKQPFDI